jgi:transcriptional regulator with XRE-family HTH domain
MTKHNAAPTDSDEDRAARRLIGDRIKAAVAALGGRVPTAELLGRSPSAVSSWAHGHTQPDLVLLRRLAIATQLSADYLVGLDVPEPKPGLPSVDEHANRLSALEVEQQDHAVRLEDHDERIEAIEAQLARNALDMTTERGGVRNPSSRRQG